MGYTNRDGGSNRYGFDAPVELGKVYEADIVEMSRRGDAGVAKIEGFVVFVSDTKPGEHVKFEITKVGRRYATADVVKDKADATADVVKDKADATADVVKDKADATADVVKDKADIE